MPFIWGEDFGTRQLIMNCIMPYQQITGSVSFRAGVNQTMTGSITYTNNTNMMRPIFSGSIAALSMATYGAFGTGVLTASIFRNSGTFLGSIGGNPVLIASGNGSTQIKPYVNMLPNEYAFNIFDKIHIGITTNAWSWAGGSIAGGYCVSLWAYT